VATQAQIDLCLQAVGSMSTALGAATNAQDPDMLAAFVAACQLSEAVAQNTPLGQFGQAFINDVIADVKPILGPPYSTS
jgi:hypothetical protein